MTISHTTNTHFILVAALTTSFVSGCSFFPAKQEVVSSTCGPNTMTTMKAVDAMQATDATQATAIAASEIENSLKTLESLTSVAPHNATLLEMENTLIGVENSKDEEEIQQLQNLTQIKSEAELALREAEQNLLQAQNAKDASDMRHIAYLAQQQAQIAARIAQRKLIEATREEQIPEQVNFLKELQQLEGNALGEQLTVEQEKNRQLKAELEDLQTGTILILGDVLFEVDEAGLIPIALHNIKKLASFLKENQEHKAFVKGYTDNVGSAAYNIDLSLRRANSVRSALIREGVNSNRIVAEGLGMNSPIASNDTHAGRQQNRRVEISLLKNQDR